MYARLRYAETRKKMYTRKINMAAVIGMFFLFGTRYIPRPRFDCTKVCRVLKWTLVIMTKGALNVGTHTAGGFSFKL